VDSGGEGGGGVGGVAGVVEGDDDGGGFVDAEADVPVGVPLPAAPVTSAVKVTFAPRGSGLPSEVRVVVDGVVNSK
jgi:hypothetical protein